MAKLLEVTVQFMNSSFCGLLRAGGLRLPVRGDGREKSGSGPHETLILECRVEPTPASQGVKFCGPQRQPPLQFCCLARKLRKPATRGHEAEVDTAVAHGVSHHEITRKEPEKRALTSLS